jgi:hypothetical protein
MNRFAAATTVPRTARQLRSEKPSNVAWGAYRAAEFRLLDLVPDLVRKLAAPPTGEKMNPTPFARRCSIAPCGLTAPCLLPCSNQSDRFSTARNLQGERLSVKCGAEAK